MVKQRHSFIPKQVHDLNDSWVNANKLYSANKKNKTKKKQLISSDASKSTCAVCDMELIDKLLNR